MRTISVIIVPAPSGPLNRLPQIIHFQVQKAEDWLNTYSHFELQLSQARLHGQDKEGSLTHWSQGTNDSFQKLTSGKNNNQTTAKAKGLCQGGEEKAVACTQVYPPCTSSVTPTFTTSKEISHTKRAEGREGGHTIRTQLIYIFSSTAIVS